MRVALVGTFMCDLAVKGNVPLPWLTYSAPFRPAARLEGAAHSETYTPRAYTNDRSAVMPSPGTVIGRFAAGQI